MYSGWLMNQLVISHMHITKQSAKSIVFTPSAFNGDIISIKELQNLSVHLKFSVPTRDWNKVNYNPEVQTNWANPLACKLQFG